MSNLNIENFIYICPCNNLWYKFLPTRNSYKKTNRQQIKSNTMKKLYSIILFAFVCAIANSQTSIPGGIVSGTWTLAGSPYQVQGSIQVPNDSTLTIQPG